MPDGKDFMSSMRGDIATNAIDNEIKGFIYDAALRSADALTDPLKKLRGLVYKTITKPRSPENHPKTQP